MAEKVSVTAYLTTQRVTGNFLLPDGKRLSDILNSSTSGSFNNGYQFLELSDVVVSHADGKIERSGASYINKEAIQLLTTLEADTARGIGAQSCPKQYPYVKKKLKWTKMCMPNYEITGNLHCCDGQGAPYANNANLVFLPLTEVKLRTTENNDYWKVAFAAVNKNQIISLRHDQN